ncbi:hypothetical protein ACMD2_20575 [Ananas comosus]|uniref:Transposase MuDR plant domain-containing protein n=1 Tax=Ananas comosus TaxID=4615 RepID=A0A199W569_ANACO|nr:hypothetical protein ACMD2_20575 [Ananas comosus]
MQGERPRSRRFSARLPRATTRFRSTRFIARLPLPLPIPLPLASDLPLLGFFPSYSSTSGSLIIDREEHGFFQVKFNYAGYFKTVKTACGPRYCDGKKHSLMIDLDSYNLTELCRDVRSLWDWGVTENIEPVDESDATLSEDSFRSLKTDDSDLEDNMDHVGTFSYDVNNPIMEIGAKYPNVSSFRDALTHFALLNEFEYNLQKSDLLRVTATCAKFNCKWRIHASRLQDSLVFQIKTLQGEHTCTSANRCRNKVATQSWVCNRVIEWLRLEEDLSTTELRKRLQQKYYVDLTYSKIFRGKEMALSKIHGHWEYSKFGTIAKCDYLTNNISESFNAWISNDRHRPLIDMLDTIRQKIMVKMEDRRNRARK